MHAPLENTPANPNQHLQLPAFSLIEGETTQDQANARSPSEIMSSLLEAYRLIEDARHAWLNGDVLAAERHSKAAVRRLPALRCFGAAWLECNYFKEFDSTIRIAAARRAAAVAVRLFQVSVANGFEFPRRREPLCSPATPAEAWGLFQHFLDRACVESAPAGAPHQYGNTRP